MIVYLCGAKQTLKFHFRFKECLRSTNNKNPVELATFSLSLKINTFIYIIFSLNLMKLLHLFKFLNFVYVICTKFPHFDLIKNFFLFSIIVQGPIHTLPMHYLNCEIVPNTDIMNLYWIYDTWKIFIIFVFESVTPYSVINSIGVEQTFSKYREERKKNDYCPWIWIWDEIAFVSLI